MSQEKAFAPQGPCRLRLLRGAAVVVGLGAVGVLGLLPRPALACHTYVSSVDGMKGCGALTRDLNNGVNTSTSSSSSSGGSSSSSGGSSSGSSSGSSGSSNGNVCSTS